MKIIKRGKLPQDASYKATCETCGTVFKFIQKEGKIYDDQRDGNYIEVKCPLCSSSVTVGL